MTLSRKDGELVAFYPATGVPSLKADDGLQEQAAAVRMTD